MAMSRRFALGVFMVVMSVAIFVIMIYGMVTVSGMFAFLMFLWLALVSTGVVLINNGFPSNKVGSAQDSKPTEMPGNESGHIASYGNGNGYCPGCGSPLNPTDSYCGVCGRKL